MEGYTYIDSITSDVMFEARGKDLKEVFENASKALLNVICQTDRLSEEDVQIITADGDDEMDLLYNFLQEIIATIDIEEMFFRRCAIKEISKKHLIATCYGETMTPEKGETVVKAVTNHGFSLKKDENGRYKATICCDI